MGDGEGTIGKVVTLAAAAAGLVAYVYLLGGIVVWLRMTTALLPGDVGIVASDSRHLLSVGSRVAAFEVLLLIGVSAIVTPLVALATLRRDTTPSHSPRTFGDVIRAWNDLPTLLGMIGLAAPLLLIAIGLSVSSKLGTLLWVLGLAVAIVIAFLLVRREPSSAGGSSLSGGDAPVWVQLAALVLLLVNVGVAVAVVPLLQGTILLAGTVVVYASPIVNWPRARALRLVARELVKSSGVWLGVAASTAVALAWVGTPPVGFDQATVVRTGGASSLTGAYLDRNGEGTYLGFCEPRDHLAARGSDSDSSRAWIKFVTSEKIRGLIFSNDQYRFDTGERPSLAQVVLAGLDSADTTAGSAPLDDPLLHGRIDDACEVKKDD